MFPVNSFMYVLILGSGSHLSKKERKKREHKICLMNLQKHTSETPFEDSHGVTLEVTQMCAFLNMHMK